MAGLLIDGIYRPPTPPRSTTTRTTSTTSTKPRARSTAEQEAFASHLWDLNVTNAPSTYTSPVKPSISDSIRTVTSAPVSAPKPAPQPAPVSKPAAPTPGGSSEPPGQEDNLNSARAEALQAALDAIAAQFGAEEAQLLANLAGVGNEYRLRVQAVQEAEEIARRQAIEESVRRGIARSSLAAQDQAKIVKSAADQKAQVAGEFGTEDTTGTLGTRAQSIQSALQLLAQQMQAAEVQATSQADAGTLDLESLLALIGTGISGSNLGA